MNVSDQCKQVLVLITDDGLVSSLKYMPNLSVGPVEVLRVRLLQALHKPGEGREVCLYKNVDVVGHEAISVDSDSEPLPVVAKAFQIGQVILFGDEGF